jgi:predicted RND superfamily exporter protein
MHESFLSRRTMFGISGAMLILFLFFFLLPSAFRGARLAVAGKKNNIKDWLPADFRETIELDWFAKYFIGESFVVATWDGCTPVDQRLSILATKLRRESAERDLTGAPPDIARARELAEKYHLMLEPSDMDNWGGLQEKWFATPSGRFYFMTPDGYLHRFNEESNIVSGIAAAVSRQLGNYELKGQFIAALGEPTTPSKVNVYYNDPSLLAASLFQSVQTGPDLVEELAREGGPLWPVDSTDVSQRAEVARSRAMERLTGTLFAPAVPAEFPWTPAAVFERLPESIQAMVPKDFDYRVRTKVDEIAARHGGTIESLHHIATEDQNYAWEELCDALGIPVPPRQTCVLVTLTTFGKDHLARAVGRGVLGGPRGRLLILADQSGVAAAPPPSMAPPPFDRAENMLADASGRSMLRMGGPPVDNVAIDEEGTVTLIRLVGYSGLVGLVLSFLCFRSVKLTIMIFMVGVSAAVLGLAITYWTGGNVDAILMSMPSLVYVSGLSGAIHIVNYYRDEVKQRGVKGAADRAIAHAIKPCFLAAFTTSIGLFSLCASSLVPIRNFGLYAGIAILTTTVILFTYLPAALETFPPNFVPKGNRKRDKKPSPQDALATATVAHNRFTEWWASFGRWIAAHHALVSMSFVLLFCVSFVGLFDIKTSVQLLKLFDTESRILSDYAYLEKNFGKLVPMELVVRMPPAMVAEKDAESADAIEPIGALHDASDPLLPIVGLHPLNVLERVEAIGRIDTVVRRSLGEVGTGVIGKTMSATTFLPALPELTNGYSPVRARFQNQLNASLDDLQATDMFRREANGPREGSELWRISLRVAALSDVDYGQFVGDLRLAVTPVINAYRARALILNQLEQLQADSPSRTFPRLLFIGHAEPKRLTEERFLVRPPEGTKPGEPADTESLILPNTIYAATVAELMQVEKVKHPVWIDLASPDVKVRPGDERWEKLLQAVDCVVLIGEGTGLDPEAISLLSKSFVDARPSVLPVAAPMLEGTIPVEANAGPFEAVYTGIVPVVYKAQRTLLVSLVESIAMAFVLIAIVMAVLLVPGYWPNAITRPKVLACGVMAACVAMIPNLFPIVIVFGYMGHMNVLVDIGTMMTASVALGVAVDDTIHFLSWFRHFIDAGLSRVEAVIETYRRVGPAMLQTTVVGGLGLFVFSLSTFTPTQRFGTLMLILLVTALFGDLILLPALLAGPLGRWFRPRPPRPESDSPSDVEHGSQVSLAATPAAISSSMQGDASDRGSVVTHNRTTGPPSPKAMDRKDQTTANRRSDH